MFLIGGLTGIPLALPAFNIHVHDSMFVVGHFHYVLGMAMTFAAFSGVLLVSENHRPDVPETLGKSSASG